MAGSEITTDNEAVKQPTTRLYDANNSAVNVPDELVHDEIISGRLRPQSGYAIPMVTPDGILFDAAPRDYKDEAAKGARYATRAIRKQIRDKEELAGPVGTAVATGAAVARGATFTASDYVAGKIAQAVGGDDAEQSVKKYLKDIEAANPTASTLGEIAGVIAPTLLTGGLSLPETLAVKATTKIAPKAGLELAAKIAAKNAPIARQMATAAIRGGVDSALYEGTSAITEDYLDNKELTAEHVFSRAAGGLLLGGVAGAGVGGIIGKIEGRTAGKLAKKALANAQDEVVAKVEKEIGDTVAPEAKGIFKKINDLTAKVTKASGGQLDDSTRQFMDDIAADPSLLNNIANRDEVIEQSTRKLSDAIQKMEDYFDDAIDRYASSKADFVPNIIKKGNEPEVIDSASKMLSDLSQELDNNNKIGNPTVDGTGSPANFSRVRAAEQLKAIVDDSFFKIVKAAESGDSVNATIFNELDNVKRAFGKEAKKISMKDTDSGRAVEFFQDVYLNRLMPHLEDANLYGKAADVQKEINPLWVEALRSGREYTSRFLEQVGEVPFGEGGGKALKEFAVNKGKVQSLLNNINSVTKDNDKLILDRVIKGKKELMEGLHSKLGRGDKEGLRAAADAVREMEEALTSASKTATVVNQVKKLNDAAGSAAMNVFGVKAAAAGAVIGGATAGPVGAVIGGVLGGIADTLSNPMRVASTVAALRRASDGVRSGMLSGVDDMFKRGISGAKKTAKPVLFSPFKRDRDRRPDKEAVVKQLESDMTKLEGVLTGSDDYIERLNKAMLGIGERAPGVSQAIAMRSAKAADYLLSIMPKRPGVSKAMRPDLIKWQPSDQQVSNYRRAEAVVKDPTIVFKNMSNGTLTRHEVDALRAVYPEIYADMQAVIMQRIQESKEPLDYQTRRTVSLYFDMPSDATLHPEFIAAMQARFAEQQQQSAPQQKPGGSQKITLGGLRNFDRTKRVGVVSQPNQLGNGN